MQPNDVVYFLGDAADRGFDGWKLIKTIYADNQFVYIKGNHEDMLVKAISAYSKSHYVSREYKLLEQNGGKKTFEDWFQDGANVSWAEKLNNLPTHFEFINQNNQIILLSHAGYTPWAELDDKSKPALPFDFNLIWDREHLLDDWDDEECVANSIVIHGHTVIPSLMRRLCDKRDYIPFGAYWYCDNHKVCIDNYSVASGKTCLINLDTLEHIIVEV